jgi:hypothetical protein
MNQQIRLKAEMKHNAAQDRYALALNDDYRKAINGRSKSHAISLRKMALALLGSPFCRVSNRKWNEDALAWLLAL